MPNDIKEFKLIKTKKDMFTREYHLYEIISGKPVRMKHPNSTKTYDTRFPPKVGQLELIRTGEPGEHKHYACRIQRVRFNRVYISSEGFEVPCICSAEALAELKRERKKAGINDLDGMIDLCETPSNT